MPNLSADSGAIPTQTDGIGWLKFVVEKDCQGIKAALFRTSEQTEPRNFCFARVDCSGIRGSAAARYRSALRNVAVSLLRNTYVRPQLLIGLADEIPPGLFSDSFGLDIPFCRIRQASTIGLNENGLSASGFNGHQLLWETERPSGGSEVQRLLRSVQERTEPFEPFQRAAAGVKEAFDDMFVQSMTDLPGLTTVTCLSAVAESPDEPTDSKMQSSSLAARLREVLALPTEEFGEYRLTWAGELMPFQQEGVQALLNNHRLLLADDMGLGKTIQVISALRILLSRRDITSCLVAAPASILDQWRREILKWAPEFTAIIIRGTKSERHWQWRLRRNVTLVSYDMLRSEFGDRDSPAFLHHWDVVVADEAQRIKNRNETSRALKGLRRTRSWALTGTPIENHEEELASILEYVDHDGGDLPPRYTPGAALRDRHRQLQLRRKKSEVLDDLPPKQITLLPIELSRSQRNSYDRAEKEGIVYLKSLGAEVGIQHVLELITRLKQICNVDFQTGESCKLADIEDRLDQLTAQGHRALIFSQYTSEESGVAAAAQYLRKFNPLTLTGAVPGPDRPAVIDQFREGDNHKALILSLRVGGLGLNLQEASYVFHLDRWWNPAVERQAEDRTHRMGQTVKVNVIKYSCVDTIEQRIDEILRRKQDLFDQLVDDVSLSLSTKLSREELLGLFGL